jgi:molecular chaperone DnaK
MGKDNVTATPPTVGIDLGTTNSVVAYVDPTGRPSCITNFDGDILTPSMVLIEGDAAVVGREARKAAALHPHRFAECFKRSMGDDYFPQEVDGRRWRPEALSAMVLKRLRNDVTRQLGKAEATVITVPAFFDECRRRATQNAGAIAGWQVLDIVNEPTAAAIAYAHREGRLGRGGDQAERILVYDLGGGTFDTTILEVRLGREYRTIATEGEVRLGGHDWDERLCHHLAEQFRSKTGCDPLPSPQGRIELTQLAQNVKHTLSVRKTTSVPCLFEEHRCVLEVSQATFEQLTSDLLERSKTTTELVLEEAKMGWKDIDKVLMIGGSTRMPMVGRMLHQLTGKPPDQTLSPDEAVAHGAAVYAHLRGKEGGARVINVNSHSYRIICLNKEGKRVAVPVIPKNSALPKQNTRLIPIKQAGMGGVSIVVCEGEADDPEMCYTVGKVRVQDLPTDSSKRWVVGVTLKCQEDGNIAVDASVRDPEALGTIIQRISATLVPNHGMDHDEVARTRKMLEAIEVN